MEGIIDFTEQRVRFQDDFIWSDDIRLSEKKTKTKSRFWNIRVEILVVAESSLQNLCYYSFHRKASPTLISVYVKGCQRIWECPRQNELITSIQKLDLGIVNLSERRYLVIWSLWFIFFMCSRIDFMVIFRIHWKILMHGALTQTS